MTILEMSAGGAVLIASILVLRRIALYRLPKWSFLLLWAVALCRLLIPFSVPSQFSIYSGAVWIAQILEQEESPSGPAGEQPPVMLAPATVPGTFREDIWPPSAAPAVPAAPAPERESASPLTAGYLLGGALCGLYFVIAYGVKIRRFSGAEPVDSDFLNQWQKEHPTLLPVTIKTCGAIRSPIAYGLLWPVVLLPENTDWSDEDQLTYVLTHEYVHIRRGDLGWKLLLTAALCVHWFNPLVWLMYIRANQDLELACDEAVVRIFGLDNRKNYACALLAASESAFSPLCITYATKSHMEERIRAIMKMKKKSTAVIICAAMLVAGISAVFATSPKPVEGKNVEDLPSAVMTDQTVKPAPTPGEQDVPKTIPDRVHTIISSTVPQTTPADPEQNAEPVQQPVDSNVKPIVASGADITEPDAPPVSAPPVFSFDPDDPVEFWGIPEGPIVAGAVLNAHNEEEFREMIRQLRTMGYDGSFALTGHPADGRGIVMLGEDYDGVVRTVEAPERFNPDWTYRVNSKGETYGTIVDYNVLGYHPDLIGVVASNGAAGYAFLKEMNYRGYQGPMETLEDTAAYMEWCKTQPPVIKIPVYDVDRNNVVGYYEAENADSQDIAPDRVNEILSNLERGLRQHTDKTEEEIAQELENYKQSHGWN